MAIWHLKFSLIPIDGILKNHHKIVSKLPDYAAHNPDEPMKEEHEFVNYWAGIERQPSLVESLELLLPPKPSWIEGGKMFSSNEHGNEIQVLDGDINCAIDVRNIDLSLLKEILDIAKKMQCLIVIKGEGKVIDPDMSQMIDEVKSSKAMKFLRDPTGFIKSQS